MFRRKGSKQIVFTVPLGKEVTRIDINVEEITINLTYVLQFIDSTSFMASLLSNLGNNFSEEIHKIKIMTRSWKNEKLSELNISMTPVFLNTSILKMI